MGSRLWWSRCGEREDESGSWILTRQSCASREGHKGIIIGKGGETLKKAGSLARMDMENFFGCKVNLKLWVKVKEDWRNRQNCCAAWL